jgi:hypothetical protein
MSAIKENPVLFGCLAFLGFLSLLACAGVISTYFLADKIVEKGAEMMEELGAKAGTQAGLKDPFTTVPELLGQGWTLSIDVQGQDEVQFTLISQAQTSVDCAGLQSVLFPYLAGSKETVVVKSENRSVDESGAVTLTPVECRWSGYPGRDGETAGGLPAATDGSEAAAGGEVVPAGDSAPAAVDPTPAASSEGAAEAAPGTP